MLALASSSGSLSGMALDFGSLFQVDVALRNASLSALALVAALVGSLFGLALVAEYLGSLSIMARK